MRKKYWLFSINCHGVASNNTSRSTYKAFSFINSFFYLSLNNYLINILAPDCRWSREKNIIMFASLNNMYVSFPAHGTGVVKQILTLKCRPIYKTLLTFSIIFFSYLCSEYINIIKNSKWVFKIFWKISWSRKSGLITFILFRFELSIDLSSSIELITNI